MITTGVRYQGKSTHRTALKGLSEPCSSLASTYSTLTALLPILLHHQLGSSAIDAFTPPGNLSQLVSTMGRNNATCEKPSSSVPKGTCCQTAVKSPLLIGSPSFLLDSHQLTSTLQAMCGSMVMTHASEGECKARAHLLMLEPHAACGNMGMHERQRPEHRPLTAGSRLRELTCRLLPEDATQ